MAKRKARKHGLTSRSGRKRTGKRPTAIRAGRRKTAKRAKATPKKRAQTAKGSSAGKAPAARGGKVPRLNRARRTLDEETVRNTPPSSLNMNRRGSAARSGRAELDQSRRAHRSMTPEIAGGDVDVDVEDAYFTGEERGVEIERQGRRAGQTPLGAGPRLGRGLQGPVVTIKN